MAYDTKIAIVCIIGGILYFLASHMDVAKTQSALSVVHQNVNDAIDADTNVYTYNDGNISYSFKYPKDIKVGTDSQTIPIEVKEYPAGYVSLSYKKSNFENDLEIIWIEADQNRVHYYDQSNSYPRKVYGKNLFRIYREPVASNAPPPTYYLLSSKSNPNKEVVIGIGSIPDNINFEYILSSISVN